MRVIIASTLFLAGCVTASDYQSDDISNRQADMDACMAEATREVPQRLDYAGIDLNADIRLRYFNGCMSELGYSTPSTT